MKTLNLEQGSQEWLDVRKSHFTASEAPAMMGESKYMSRSKLLDLKKGAVEQKISSKQQALFDKGHAAEDAARNLLEIEELEEFPPVVASFVVGDLPLLASFDGLKNGLEGELVWEHKLFNQTLAENIQNNVIEPFYYWQLEHQMLVAKSTKALFTCSDGTEEKRFSMIYESVPERREQLIAGWTQFAKDLEKHQLEAKTEVVKANEIESLPLVQYEMNGLVLASNFQTFKQAAEVMVKEAKKPLESDQDFADADFRVKEFKSAETKIKAVSEQVLGEVQSIDEFTRNLKEIGELIRQARLATEKQIKTRKEEIKTEIIQDAEGKLDKLRNSIHAELKVFVQVDYSAIALAMKGKKTTDSLKDAAATALAKLKVEANEQASAVRANAELMKSDQYNEYKFLFADWASIAFKANDDFEALVKSRIADHKQAEFERQENEKAIQLAKAEQAKPLEVPIKAEVKDQTQSANVQSINHIKPTANIEKQLIISFEVQGGFLTGDARRIAKLIMGNEIKGVTLDLAAFSEDAA